LSEAYAGSVHDYAMLKAELPPGDQGWFDKHLLWVDLGFLGIEKDYSPKKLGIPFKKSKNNPLNEEQKELNKCISSFRVTVEHSIGGFKRYRFLSDRLRCRDIMLYNLVAGVCAGLWNFCLIN
jgi:DDE superfamily endonuclease